MEKGDIMQCDIEQEIAVTETPANNGGIREILTVATQRGASDVHINAGLKPILRINTELVPLDCDVVTEQAAREMAIEILGRERFLQFEKNRDFDFSTKIANGSRFRVNAHFQRDTVALAFRVIPNAIPDIDSLNLPQIVKELATLPRGLVLVTGHTGSGKSTSLAAMIDAINKRFRKRIITLEDPVEYALENGTSMIEQREIGQDCLNFASGLRHALRQDPDIILVGEMRDLETTSSTITAAETGHLVFSSLHTINAPQTIERIIDIYPAAQQNQIRTMLANTLQAVISQTLFKRTDKPGMVPCVEILLCTSAVRNCIRENRIFEIPNIISTSRRIGMQEMDYSIAQNYFLGRIEKQEAIMRSTNPGRMEKIFETGRPEDYLGVNANGNEEKTNGRKK